MARRYLLDTNICIYIRQKRPAQVLERFTQLNVGEAFLSVVTFGELLYGVAKSQHRIAALEKLDALVSFLPVLPLPAAAAEHYGKLRAELEQKGQSIGGNDLWIAAHALAEGLVLVSNDEREFRRIPGLTVENWAA
jgi:tRNA(fMet)-specific endonuclease VapC